LPQYGFCNNYIKPSQNTLSQSVCSFAFYEVTLIGLVANNLKLVKYQKKINTFFAFLKKCIEIACRNVV